MPLASYLGGYPGVAVTAPGGGLPVTPPDLLKRIVFSTAVSANSKLVFLALCILSEDLPRIADEQIGVMLGLPRRTVRKCMAELRAAGFIKEPAQ